MSQIIDILTNPSTWLGALALALIGALLYDFIKKVGQKLQPRIPGTAEYRERVEEQARRDRSARQDNDVVFEHEFGTIKFYIYSGDIRHSTAQVIVSSDDSQLSATGGVAKAIVEMGGDHLRRRLRFLARYQPSLGTIAITDGGRSKYTYIFHAVVLTKTAEYTQYPNRDKIEGLVHNIINLADAVGVKSLALPVLASGTAAKRLKLEENLSDQQITFLVAKAAVVALKAGTRNLQELFLVIFDRKQFTNDLENQLRDVASTV